LNECTYSFLASDEVTHMIDGDCWKRRNVGAHVDGQEAVALPLGLELGCELCSRHLLPNNLV